MNDRTAMGIGHWAFTHHRTQAAPAWGFWEGEGARASRSAAAGLVLCRIRRTDKEVQCISCPYWRLLHSVKGLPHPSRPTVPRVRGTGVLTLHTQVCPDACLCM